MVAPSNINNWPSSEQRGLDDDYLRAFKEALTSDICFIQGPPRTEKTFLGLKIVEVLLNIIKRNRNCLRTPILVVCFTNYALDQFLEGIIPWTENIVRVGGQSRSDARKPYHLREAYNYVTRKAAFTYVSKNLNGNFGRDS